VKSTAGGFWTAGGPRAQRGEEVGQGDPVVLVIRLLEGEAVVDLELADAQAAA
jgi:hypothetical protein